MSEMKNILVGVVTRNRSDILPKALESALAQSAPNVTIAVIDDGSTDSTPTLPARFPQVDWVRRETGRGYMSARNELMARPNIDLFVSLDDDAWFLRNDEIEIAVAYLRDHPDVAAVAFDIVSPDQPKTRERGVAQPVSMFIGCGHMLRLDAVRKVGEYDPTPGSYGGEEKDLCLRLMDAGYSIVRLTGVHVWHDKTPVAREIPAQHRSGVCNDLVMTFRRSPLFVLPIVLPMKLFRHLRFSAKAGLVKPCLEGFLLFARSFPSICLSRRAVRWKTLQAYVQLTRRSANNDS